MIVIATKPYQYVAGDPLDQSDPTGLFCLLGHNPNGSCQGSGVIDSIENLSHDVLDAVSDIAGLVQLGADGLAAASLWIPGVDLFAPEFFAAVSEVAGLTATVATCLNGGISVDHRGRQP